MAGRLSVRRRRREGGGFRLHKPHWVDPFPFIPGTEPEKRIFEALVRRHHYFIFQGDIPELSRRARARLAAEEAGLLGELRQLENRILKLDKAASVSPVELRRKQRLLGEVWAKRALLRELSRRNPAGVFVYEPAFKPDFVLPEYRVILDPFGIFHHSLPEAVKRDAVKSVVYRALGYAFYHPWWDERGFFWADAAGGGQRIRRVGFDTVALLMDIPELRRGPTQKLVDPADIAAKKHPGYRLGENLGLGANSVALANSKRKRPPRLTLSGAGRRRRRVRQRV